MFGNGPALLSRGSSDESICTSDQPEEPESNSLGLMLTSVWSRDPVPVVVEAVAADDVPAWNQTRLWIPWQLRREQGGKRCDLFSMLEPQLSLPGSADRGVRSVFFGPPRYLTTSYRSPPEGDHGDRVAINRSATSLRRPHWRRFRM